MAGRLVMAVVVGVTAGVVAVAVPVPVGADPVGCVESASSAAVAAEVAVACGRRVEDLSGLSELERRFVNPDRSMTVEVAAVPQRARQGEAFVPVDFSLTDAGGVVRPAAGPVDVRLSGGGGGAALVSVGWGGAAVSWRWPGVLPKPVLDGDTAVYRDVPVRDVDLLVRVGATGVSTRLVVKSRAAAADAVLQRLEFGITTQGVTARAEEATGAVSWVDADGRVVFATGAAAMWDSRPATAEQAELARSSGDQADGVWTPGAGARRTAVPVQVAAGRLVMVPDPVLLADETAVLPLVIDPDVSRTNWAMINSRYVNQCYVMCGGYDNAGHMKTGWTTDDGGMAYRSMVDFSGGSFAGKRILDAKMESYLLHSSQCSDSLTHLHSVGAFGSGTTWNNHVSSWSASLASVNNQNCNDAANVRAEWGSTALTSYVHSRAQVSGAVYLGLRGNSESSTAAWKKFNENNTKLLVTYNSYPTAPSSLGTYNSASTTAQPCTTGSGRPFVRSPTPIVKAKPNDPDGGAETNLRIRFTLQSWNGSAWVALGGQVVSTTNLTVNDLGSHTLPASLGLANGSRIRWQAETVDPWSYGASSGTDYSPPSAWCEFDVDTQPPSTPPGVSSSTYPEYQPGVDEDYHGCVGCTAAFTFTSGGIGDVAGWMWGWADPPATYVAAPSPGASQTVQLTPPPPFAAEPTAFGTLTLFVRSVDRTGIPDGTNAMRIYIMRVGSATDPVATWKLDDPAGAGTLADTGDPGGHPATPTNLTLAAPGRLLSGPDQTAPTAASFNGTSSYATTSTPVIDTSKSFTVSAWVRPDANNNGWRAIVAATDTVHSAFFLRRDGSNNFHFTLVAGSTWTGVATTTGVGVGAWVHLVGVYDQGAGQAHLYVDGRLIGSTAVPSVLQATGGFEIGRAWWSNSWAYHPNWQGAISEVRVWQRVLTAGEITPMAATPVGWWTLDGNGADDSGWGRTATTTDITWNTTHQGTPAAQLNGATSYGTTAGPAIDTTNSFTVSAWVRPDANNNGWRAIVAATGSVHSAFFLRRDGNNNFHFTLVNSSTWPGVYTTTGSVVGTWVHLVGVYDRGAGVAHLYVNGQLIGSVAVPAVITAPYGFEIGRALWAGSWAHHPNWNGAIDDVHVFAGAMPAAEVAKLYQP